jgi:hypothetical protein
MLAFALPSMTRLTQQMAAVLAVPGAAPRPAAADSLLGTRATRPTEADAAVAPRRAAPIFSPLPDGPAARVHDSEADWLHLAMHYRPSA